MALHYVLCPLYEDPDYEYTITLNREAYRLRFYFIEREQRWAFDLRNGDRTPIVLGAAAVAEYPIFIDYYLPTFEGFFWIEPIGQNRNETVSNPYNLSEYFRLYYYRESED